MKTIGSIVTGRETYHLGDGQTVREAARYMTERRVGAVAVLSGSRLAGIVSERDIMGRVVAKGLDPDQVRVGEVMTKDLVVAHAGDSHDDGLRKMKQAGCRHLPVVEGDRLIGMVSQRDLLQIDLTEKDEEIRWLNAYIHFIPPAREGTS
ncbi:MAG TPA: CBS domain-containing protein [Vicinamibacteria bacterium]|jgi:CBS domain-containing protein|nr:CBS domain-containing protein [Vicinamibacteria bacterium]